MFKGKIIGVVVPAYNEEKLITRTIQTIPKYIDRIITVDDYSKDQTNSILKRLAQDNPKLMIIRHEKNRGVGAAIVSGYKQSLKENLDITAVMAGDAQMDPEDLPNLLTPVAEDITDYSKGNRLFVKRINKIMPPLRYFGNSTLTILNKIATGYWHIIDPQSGYTAISKKALKTIQLDKLYPRYGIPNDILAKLNVFNFRVKDISIKPIYRQENSGIRLHSAIPKISWLLLKLFLWRLKEKYVKRDFHPLVLFYLSGILVSLIGWFLGFYILYLKFLRDIVASPATVMLCVLMILIGTQSIFFGMWFDMEYNRNLNK